MINYNLPQEVDCNGSNVAIRSDWRPNLDICVLMQDSTLTEREKAYGALKIFYPNGCGSDLKEACDQLFSFLSGDLENEELYESSKPNSRPVVYWEQDFPLIIAPVNRIAGCDIRGLPYLHWWTFLSYFQEIGECVFSQVIAIREKRNRGKKLTDIDRDFYKRNKEIVDFKRKKQVPSDWLQNILKANIMQNGGV
jgi:hypothetical protein